MVATPSTMLPLGTPVPDFRLTEVVRGQAVGPSDFVKAKALVVAFLCNHCPYVIHVRPELVKLLHGFMDRGVAVIAINSNSAKTHPQDGPEAMKRLATEEGWRFPFVFDASQEVAKAFRAACTPDFFVFDAGQRLAYRGQLDGSRPGNGVPVTGKDLAEAVEAVLAGGRPSEAQRPSMGCNIKWDPGNAPEYFG
jgi:peroxiredoxin